MIKHSKIEKVVFGTGLIIILSIMGYLVYEMGGPKHPPQLKVTSNYEPGMEHYGFEVVVQNLGEQSAAKANIQLKLYQDGKAVENGTLSFAYVPKKSRQKGWVVFYQEREPTDSLVVASITFIQE